MINQFDSPNENMYIFFFNVFSLNFLFHKMILYRFNYRYMAMTAKITNHWRCRSATIFALCCSLQHVLCLQVCVHEHM